MLYYFLLMTLQLRKGSMTAPRPFYPFDPREITLPGGGEEATLLDIARMNDAWQMRLG
jgi:hypothetical protein